jgi:hypothetical protein
MSIFEKLRALFHGSRRFQLEPDWQVGHTVTYRLLRDDDSRFVMRLRCLGQDRKEPGTWVVLVDMREDDVQTVAVLKTLPRVPGDASPRTVPMHAETLFGDPGENSMLSADCQMVMAIDLLNVRHLEAAQQALLKPPSAVTLACDIDRVHALEAPCPEPGFDKVHHLSRRVPLTGVASSTVLGHKNETTVQAFACNNPNSRWPGFQDYIDWSEVRPVCYENLEFSIPETWLLAPLIRDHPGIVEQIPKDKLGSLELTTTEGGNTCALSIFLSRFDGDSDFLAEKAKEISARVRVDEGGQVTDVLVDERDDMRPMLLLQSLSGRGMVGLASCALLFNEDRTSLVKLSGNHFVSDDNPRKEQSLMNAEGVFRQMMKSLRFTEESFV